MRSAFSSKKWLFQRWGLFLRTLFARSDSLELPQPIIYAENGIDLIAPNGTDLRG
jgi:hypothetical protein